MYLPELTSNFMEFIMIFLLSDDDRKATQIKTSMLQATAQPHPAISHSHGQFESRTGMKRIGDLAICCALIALSFPLLIVIALMIKLHGGGPILVGEDRRVSDGRLIRVLRFRTNARQPTMLGRFLYCTRLVDLPQLINVLRGEMSLVDPTAVHPDFLD
jgi:lipopolysaccharide/colanic/teichoic acid biosynthesis glycosyltransferase